MKVLFLATDVFFKGGVQRYSRYQYNALTELYGQESIYLFSLKKPSENAFEDTINVYYHPNREYDIASKISFTLNVIFFLIKQKIDLIIVNHRQLGPLALSLKMFFKIPYLINIYGLEIWSGLSKLELLALQKATQLIGDCNFIISFVKFKYKFPDYQLKLLFDPVDLTRFKPQGKKQYLLDLYSLNSSRLILGTIGRLERNKGHAAIIKCLPNLPTDIVYLIVGGGYFREDLEGLVESLNLQQRVIFCGRVPEDELVEYYNLPDIVLLLSHFGHNEGEGLPLGLIEAGACSKPLIAGNEDGSIDAISTDLPNGFLIDPFNSDQLIQSILYYYHNPTMIELHGQNSRNYVDKYFNYQQFKLTLKEVINYI